MAEEANINLIFDISTMELIDIYQNHVHDRNEHEEEVEFCNEPMQVRFFVTSSVHSCGRTYSRGWGWPNQ